MRVVILIIVFILNGTAFGQSKSDLYKQVDSLVKYELKFDSSIIQRSNFYKNPLDSSPPASWHHSILTNFPNYPLVIVNKKKVDIRSLNKSTLKMAKSITVLNPSEASTLYGSQGVYGAIIIRGGEKLLRQVNSL